MRITNRTNSRSFNCVFTPSSYFAGTGWRRLECTRRSTPPRRSRRRTPTCGSSSRPRRTCAWHEYTPTRIASHTHRVSAPSRTRERAETTNVKISNLRYRARSHARRVDVPAHPRPRTREAWHGTRVVRAFSQLGARSRRRRRTWRAFECDARATVTQRHSRARVEAVAHARCDVHRELAVRRAGGAFCRARGVWFVRAQRARARTLRGARCVARGG